MRQRGPSVDLSNKPKVILVLPMSIARSMHLSAIRDFQPFWVLLATVNRCWAERQGFLQHQSRPCLDSFDISHCREDSTRCTLSLSAMQACLFHGRSGRDPFLCSASIFDKIPASLYLLPNKINPGNESNKTNSDSLAAFSELTPCTGRILLPLSGKPSDSSGFLQAFHPNP